MGKSRKCFKKCFLPVPSLMWLFGAVKVRTTSLASPLETPPLMTRAFKSVIFSGGGKSQTLKGWSYSFLRNNMNLTWIICCLWFCVRSVECVWQCFYGVCVWVLKLFVYVLDSRDTNSCAESDSSESSWTILVSTWHRRPLPSVFAVFVEDHISCTETLEPSNRLFR